MEDVYQSLKKRYGVKGLTGPHTAILFILESPHIEELIHDAPVSGLSGKAMSRVLEVPSELPLGIHLKKRYENGCFEKIGVLNICSIPMQRAAYVDERVEMKYGALDETNDVKRHLEAFESLRKAPVTKSHPFKNELSKSLLEDFSHQLMRFKRKNMLIIPCGNAARRYFKATGVMDEAWQVLWDVPHPSFGNWYKKAYQESILFMKNEMIKLLGEVK